MAIHDSIYAKEIINHQYFRQAYKCLYYDLYWPVFPKPACYCYEGAYYASIIYQLLYIHYEFSLFCMAKVELSKSASELKACDNYKI